MRYFLRLTTKTFKPREIATHFSTARLRQGSVRGAGHPGSQWLAAASGAS